MFGFVLAAVVVGSLLVTFWALGPGGAVALLEHPLPLLLATGCFLGSAAGTVTMAWIALRATGAHPGGIIGVRVLMRSTMARYAPSGMLGLAVRMHGASTLAADARQISLGFAYEQVVALAVAAGVALAGMAFGGLRSPVILAAAGISALLLVAIGSSRLRTRLLRLARRDVDVWPHVPHRAAGEMALVTLVLGWAVVGAGAVIVLDALAPATSVSSVALVGALAASVLIGALSPFGLGGLGAREAALVALLAPSLGARDALAYAVALRTLMTLADCAAWLLVELVALVWRPVVVQPD